MRFAPQAPVIPSLARAARNTLASLAIVGHVAGCANPETLTALNAAQQRCAQGDEESCFDASNLAVQAEAEEAKAAESAALLAIAAVLVIGIAALAGGDYDSDCDFDDDCDDDW